MAMGAVSICRDVKRPGSSDCRPKSPNATFEPRHARPRLLPFCIFRNFVRFGESIVLTSCSGDPAGFSGQSLALEHPDLDADDPVRRLRFGRAELDVGAERVERDPALAVGLDAAHLAAAEAAGAADPDALRAELHGRRDGFLHGATEGDAALELGRDVLGDELGVGLGFSHFLDVDEDLVVGEGLHARELRLTLGGRLQVARLQDLDALATLADDHAGPRREDDDLPLVGGALDFDRRALAVVELVLDDPLPTHVPY